MVPEGLLDEFRLLGFNFRVEGVDHEPQGVDICFLRVNLGSLRSTWASIVKFEPMGVDFGPLRGEFRFSESI